LEPDEILTTLETDMKLDILAKHQRPMGCNCPAALR